MAITDPGVPATNPHLAVSNLIVNNMASPDGVWTPVVNNEWLEHKRQKQYQIVIQPSYGYTEQAQMIGSNQPDQPKVSGLFLEVTLYAPNRTNLWKLYRVFVDLMNDGTKTIPTLLGASGVESTDYHWVRITRSEEAKATNLQDPDCGPGKQNSADCLGYRAELTLELRWNE